MMAEALIPKQNDNSNLQVDSSPIIPQRTKLTTPLTIFKRPFTDKQRQFLQLSSEKSTKIVFVSGWAQVKPFCQLCTPLN